MKILAVEDKINCIVTYLKNIHADTDVIKMAEYILQEVKRDHERWRAAARKRSAGGY